MDIRSGIESKKKTRTQLHIVIRFLVSAGSGTGFELSAFDGRANGRDTAAGGEEKNVLRRKIVLERVELLFYLRKESLHVRVLFLN